MKYYAHVDLPHIEEITTIILEKLDRFYFENTIFKIFPPTQFEHPLLVESVSKIKPWNEIAHASIITTQPFAHHKDPHTNIHQDIMTLTEWGQEQAVCLNIPIYNCDKTYVAIYEQLQDPFRLQGTYKNGHTYEALHWKQDWCREIDRMFLPKPALFYTQMPHAIINETDESRIILSIRFSTPIDLDDFTTSELYNAD
jgi:hypothetical protein